MHACNYIKMTNIMMFTKQVHLHYFGQSCTALPGSFVTDFVTFLVGGAVGANLQ